MLFQYSNSRLLTLFLIRFLPTIPFLFLALGIGEVFWIGIAFLWLLLIGEMVWYIKLGYRKISAQEIENFSLFNKKVIPRKELRNILSYNNEWAFRTHNLEIRIHRNHIRKNQRPEFDRLLAEIQTQVKLQNP
jgi:hypothetical protein